MKPQLGFLSLLCQIFYLEGVSTSWEDWWTYDGISGPDFWGLLNLEWSLCSKGRRQSPVDVDPSGLLYDPSLRPLHVDEIRSNGVITNTGHGVIFRATPSSYSEILNITGGPLSYKYRFSEIHIHFARSDEKGSEHSIAGFQFPAELQIYGYNSDLYQNISEAMALQKSQGLVGISVLMQLGDRSNDGLRVITSQLDRIVHRGQEAHLKYLSLRELLPDTEYYMTYEGSTTMPGCYETVTWIVMNKPIYITKQQLFALRKLMQGDVRNPKAPLADNFRPTLTLNQRTIRTNIEFRTPALMSRKGRKTPDIRLWNSKLAVTEVSPYRLGCSKTAERPLSLSSLLESELVIIIVIIILSELTFSSSITSHSIPLPPLSSLLSNSCPPRVLQEQCDFFRCYFVCSKTTVIQYDLQFCVPRCYYLLQIINHMTYDTVSTVYFKHLMNASRPHKDCYAPGQSRCSNYQWMIASHGHLRDVMLTR